MKPIHRRRRRNLPALLALGLMAGAVTAGGARFAAESARLAARIRQLESRPFSGENAASRPLPETAPPVSRRPAARTPPSPYTTSSRLLKLLRDRGIEVVSYSLETEKERLTLSGSAEPGQLISFFGSLPDGLPGISFKEFEISRNSGERTLLFSFAVALGKHATPVSPRSYSRENEERVLALFTPPPPTLPSARPKEVFAKSPPETPPGLQPAGALLSRRYIGSAVIDGNLRLYLMDETKMHLTRVTPATEGAGSVTERIETETVEKMIYENHVPFADLYSLKPSSFDPYSYNPYSFDPLPAASDGLRQPRP